MENKCYGYDINKFKRRTIYVVETYFIMIYLYIFLSLSIGQLIGYLTASIIFKRKYEFIIYKLKNYEKDIYLN